MVYFLNIALVVSTAFTTVVGATNINFDVKPFKIDLSAEVPRLKFLVNNTRLPAKALYPSIGEEEGTGLGFLRDLQTQWLTSFDWEAQQAELNQFQQFTVDIEGQTVHFVHEKSEDPNAIPLVLLHGWPGSFHEFLPVIKPLTESSLVNGTNVSYNVVVPGLPGFLFSSPPPLNWTVADTARIFNTLMTDVLGYETYAVHGTDWGCGVGYSLYSDFNSTVRALQLVLLPFLPLSPEEIAANNITLTAVEEVSEQRAVAWTTSDWGYFKEQSTKPNDLGLALYDSPVGQLAWIAGKYKRWSDPRAGTPPSVLDHTAILTAVSLYYLTDSFLSSIWIYEQNPNVLNPVYSKAPTDAPLLFSQYEYSIGFWPEQYVAKVGNLVSYTVHDFGGHWAGLDNPPALIGDLRAMAPYFSA
ncbi:Alpha/Beta hydrolase protein [Mycena metata]|uniref:Alpha/Beta hydrolase protein n=1 Tax=Mycena metata TaxID=1033252 RepID=A0AAD7NHA8_9AGAR|nr:Alpha/Beta hydrolase protein [Mycena metata]